MRSVPSARSAFLSREPECLEEVSRKLEPSAAERALLEEETSRVRSALWRALELSGRSSQVVAVEVEGSFARDTWLPGDVDVDIFLLFRRDVGPELLRETARVVSELAAEELSARLEVRYASHPYFVIKLKSIEVEVVPAYYTSSPAELVTPVDRTPHHTAFVRTALGENPRLKSDIRMFKKLLKSIGVYGAETWVGGFCGLLPLLRSAVEWRPGKVFVPDTEEARKFAGSPLVVLDPVDPRRNAAAAVSKEALWKLIAIARLASQVPDLLCCFIDPPKLAPDEETLRNAMRGRTFLFVTAEKLPEMPADAVKGKLTRVLRRVRKGLEASGFTVYRGGLLDLRAGPVLAFEVESSWLPPLRLHLGPPVWSPHSARFLRKWVSARSGPFLKEHRWVVVAPRKIRAVEDAARRLLSSYRDFSWAFLSPEELVNLCASEEDKKKLYSWVTGIEEWMLCFESAGA